MERSIAWMIIGFLASVSSTAVAAPLETKTYDLAGATAYSDLCTDRMTDDTNGLRVFVRNPGQTPRVVAQVAEGGLEPPVEAPSKIVQRRLRFVVPGDVPEAAFTGQVFDGYVIVRGAKRGSKPFRLNPVKAQNPLPRCR